MLKNKTDKAVDVRYNGVDLTIQPEGMLDILDFNLTVKEINVVESHFIKKFPNTFETIARETHGLSQIEADKKISDLKHSVETAQTLHGNLKKMNESLINENKELRATIQSLEGSIETFRKEVGDLKAKLKSKDMPDR